MPKQQQYILLGNLSKIYEIYKKHWKDKIIPHNYYSSTHGNLIKNSTLKNEIKQRKTLMFKQAQVVTVNLKTLRKTLEGIEPKKLSKELKTTVINYSIWESKNIEIATNGNINFKLTIDYDYKILYLEGNDNRFDSLIDNIRKSEDLSSHLDILIGPNLEKVFSILNLDIQQISIPDLKKISEVFTYEFYGNW